MYICIYIYIYIYPYLILTGHPAVCSTVPGLCFAGSISQSSFKISFRLKGSFEVEFLGVLRSKFRWSFSDSPYRPSGGVLHGARLVLCGVNPPELLEAEAVRLRFALGVEAKFRHEAFCQRATAPFAEESHL